MAVLKEIDWAKLRALSMVVMKDSHLDRALAVERVQYLAALKE